MAQITLKNVFQDVNGKTLFSQLFRWQQHVILLHAYHVFRGFRTVSLTEEYANEP